MVKAVLFDMDGVIYDSMPHHADAWVTSMNDYRLHITRTDAYRYEGMRGVETIQQLARQQWQRELTDEEAQVMYAHKSACFAALGPAAKMAGVEHLMQYLKATGRTICVVTGSGQHTLLDHLEQDFPGLLHKELMVTAFDVQHGKPAPDPYLMGLNKAGVEASEAVVVENAPLGVRAAKAAGIFTIAVNTGPLPDALLRDEGADIVVKTMAEAEQWFVKNPQDTPLHQPQKQP